MKSLLLLIFCSISLIGYSQIDNDWILASQTSNQKSKMYVKSEIVKKEGNEIKIWTKEVSNVLIENNKKYNNGYVLRLVLVNCTENQFKFINHISYDSKNNMISNDSFEDAKWNDVAPESIGEEIVSKVCELYYNKKKESFSGIFNYVSILNTLKTKNSDDTWGEEEVFKIQNNITIDLDNKKITVYTGERLLYEISITKNLETRKGTQFEDYTYSGVDKKNHPCDIILSYDLKESKMFFLKITNLRGIHIFYL